VGEDLKRQNYPYVSL